MRTARRLSREEWPRLLADYDACDPQLGGGWVKSGQRSVIKDATGLTVTELRKELEEAAARGEAWAVES